MDRSIELGNDLQVYADCMKYLMDLMMENVDNVDAMEDIMNRISYCKDKISVAVEERNLLLNNDGISVSEEHRQRDDFDDIFVDEHDLKQSPVILAPSEWAIPTENECGVCYETLLPCHIVRFDCQHFMCSGCLCNHIKSSKTVPNHNYVCHICRTPIHQLTIYCLNYRERKELTDELEMALGD